MLIKKTIREYPYLTLEESNIIENNHINTIDSNIVEDVDIILDPYSISSKDNIRVYHKESLYDYLCEDILEQVENDELLLEDIDNILYYTNLSEVRNYDGYYSRKDNGVFSYSYNPNLYDEKSFNKIKITTPNGKKEITFKQLEGIKNYILQQRNYMNKVDKEQNKASLKTTLGKKLISKKIKPSENLISGIQNHIDSASYNLNQYDKHFQSPPFEIVNILGTKLAKGILTDKNEGDSVLQAYYAVKRQNKHWSKRKEIKINKDGTVTLRAKRLERPPAGDKVRTDEDDFIEYTWNDPKYGVGTRESRKAAKLKIAQQEVQKDEEEREFQEFIDNIKKKDEEFDKDFKEYLDNRDKPATAPSQPKELKDNTNYTLRRGIALGAGAAGVYAIARKIASLKNIQNKYVRKLLLLPPAKRGKLQRIIDKIKQVIARLGKRLHK